MNKDLFGNPIKHQNTEWENYLEEKDFFTRETRSERLNYWEKLNPYGIAFAGELELIYSYTELKEIYVAGHFLSSIVLGQAWIEKTLQLKLEQTGHENIAKKNLYKMINHCFDNSLANKYLLEKVDKFRLWRNPITHLKSPDYEHNLSSRTFKNKTEPLKQLEKDAKEVIEVAIHIARFGWE